MLEQGSRHFDPRTVQGLSPYPFDAGQTAKLAKLLKTPRTEVESS